MIFLFYFFRQGVRWWFLIPACFSLVSLWLYYNISVVNVKGVNKKNINEVLEEWNEFIDHDGKNDRKDSNETVKLVERMLLEIKADNKHFSKNVIKTMDAAGNNWNKAYDKINKANFTDKVKNIYNYKKYGNIRGDKLSANELRKLGIKTFNPRTR